LAAVESLFRELNEQKIPYCLWKGSTRLREAAQGYSDFDLYVDRKASGHFKEILHKHGCKHMMSPPGKKLPGVEDYLGHDEMTGKSYHLHVYFQLILGQSLFKSYRLPLEQRLLGSSHIRNGVNLASPELEVITRVIITLSKYRNRDVFKDFLSIRTPGISPETIQTFNHLLGQTTFERISKTLKSEVNFISHDIVIRFLKIVRSSPRSAYNIYQMRNALRKQLSTFRIYSRWQAFYRFPNINKSFLGKKKLASGGMLVALVGADGAGKSSILVNLNKWLSWKLSVQNCYMGLGERLSFASRMIQVCVRFFSLLYKASTAIVGNGKWLSRNSKTIYNFAYDLHYVSIATTRYYRYLSSKKKAARGSVVLCDRYPLASLHQVMMNSTRAPMDGPRIAWKYKGQKMNRITAYLSKLELKLYKKIRPPDYVLLLQVRPNVALKRKPDHTPQEIEPKTRAIKNMDRNGLQIIDIDANQPFERALLQVKQELWKIM